MIAQRANELCMALLSAITDVSVVAYSFVFLPMSARVAGGAKDYNMATYDTKWVYMRL